MKKEYKNLISAIILPSLLVGLIWSFHSINLSNPQLELYKLGILPRSLKGLIGIITSPLIHSTDSFSHIINNTPPLFVLLSLVYITFKNKTFKILAFIWFALGLWVWISARENYHIGASGVVYGLAFFLFFSGAFRKNKQMMGISLLVAFLYGSMIWGLFPIDYTVSHEAHISGALAGIAMAIYMKNKGPVNDKYNLEVQPEFEEYVEQYNQLLELEEYWNNHANSTFPQEKDNFKYFFNYIKKEDKKKS